MRWILFAVCALALTVGGRFVILGAWSTGLVTVSAVGLLAVAAIISMGMASPNEKVNQNKNDGDETDHVLP